MANLDKYIKNSVDYKQELTRILAKNHNFQSIIGAFEESELEAKTELYKNLLQEEVDEFNQAVEDDDVGEIIKELADIFVVGAVYAKLALDYDYVNHVRDVMHVNGVYKFNFCDKDWDDPWIVNTIEEVLTSTIMMSRSFNFDFLPYLEAVIDNNFDKLPLVDSVEDPEKDAKTIETNSEGRYSGVVYETIQDAEGNERYKFLSDKGKLLKPLGYETIKFEFE